MFRGQIKLNYRQNDKLKKYAIICLDKGLILVSK